MIHTLRNGLSDATARAAALAQTPRFDVADVAPATLADVVRHYRETGTLRVWAGASEVCVFDPRSNWTFRAWHDWAHVRTALGFDVPSEIELARWQMREAGSDALARLVWVEVAEQAAHFGRTGRFVDDQIGFALARL